MEYSVDSIIYESVKICQPKSKEYGFRFGCDSPVLAWFTRAKRKWRVIDAGSGSGVIAALMAKIYGTEVTAIELQPNMFECLEKTIALCSLENKITPVQSDIRSFESGTVYDAVVCNPPYRKAGTGRVSANETRGKARFSFTMDIGDLAAFAKRNLKHGGKLFFSYDADMIIDAIYVCRKHKLEPKRMAYMYKNIGSKAKIVFVECVFGGGVELTVEPPLFQQGERHITEIYDKIFQGDWHLP